VHLARRIGASTLTKENEKMMKRLLMIASLFALVAVLTVQASAKEITVRGHLEQTVEASGWLIIADTDERTDKYLLLNPQRFRNESWFRKGAQVEATGETKPDAITVYQEGIPFEARTMRSIGSKGNEASSNLRPARVVVSGDVLVQAQPDTGQGSKKEKGKRKK
jgi:hypothetical protein